MNQSPLTMAAAGEKSEWMDVSLTNKTHVEVKGSYKNNPLLAIAEKEGYVDVRTQDLEPGMTLEHSKSYMFRVAAVNSMGVGPWSEVTAYRTLTPGLPGAPNTVKVNKSGDGAIVCWDPPANSLGTIREYAVFLAVNVSNGANKIQTLSFQRVYVGPENSCLVTKIQLQNAKIDVTGGGGKPAIIFRIAAKNDKGFGPATQVRWLQSS